MNLLRGGKSDGTCRLLVEILKMLSSKVIIAAEVLLSLESETPVKSLRDFRYPRGTDLTPLCEACRERKPLFRFVLRRLMEGGYIRSTNGKNSYALLKNPADVSLLSLVILFHGDLCIGELYAHRLTTGREDFRTPSSRRLRQWESEQYELLRHAFACTPVTIFRDAEAAATISDTTIPAAPSDAPSDALSDVMSDAPFDALSGVASGEPSDDAQAGSRSAAVVASADAPATNVPSFEAPVASVPFAEAPAASVSFAEAPVSSMPAAEVPAVRAASSRNRAERSPSDAPAGDVPIPVPASCFEG